MKKQNKTEFTKEKMKKTILYIHGFNSGAGQKAEQLKEAGFDVIAPQLEHLNATEDLKKLQEIAQKLISKNKDFEVVGTSLGGFYAMCLSVYISNFTKNYITCYHCINPSYRPYETLKRALGIQLTNYKTGQSYELKQEFLNSLDLEFKEMQLGIKNNIENIHFYLGTQDELLDFTDIEKLGKNIIYSNQNHRFSDISLIIDELKK